MEHFRSKDTTNQRERCSKTVEFQKGAIENTACFAHGSAAGQADLLDHGAEVACLAQSPATAWAARWQLVFHRLRVWVFALILLTSPVWISTFADWLKLTKAPLSFDPTTLPRYALFAFGACLLVALRLGEFFCQQAYNRASGDSLPEEFRKRTGAADCRSTSTASISTIPHGWNSGLFPYAPLLCLAFLIAWILFASSLSPHFHNTILGAYTRYNGIIPYLVYACYVVALGTMRPSRSELKLYAICLTLGSLPVCVFGYAQALDADPFGWAASFDGRAGSTFGNPNMLGVYLVICMSVSWTLFKTSQKSSYSYLSLAAFIAQLFLMFCSYNRSSIIALVVSLLVIVFLGRKHRPILADGKHDSDKRWVQGDKTACNSNVKRQVASRTKNKTVWVFAALALVLIIAGVVDYHLHGAESMFARLETIFSLDYWKRSSRVAIWESCLKAFAASPLLGYGADTFDSAIAAHFTPTLASIYHNPQIYIDSPHNLIFQQLLGGGFIQALLYLAFLISVLRCYKRALHAEPTAAICLLAAGIGSLVQLMAISESATTTTYLFCCWALIVGLAVPKQDSLSRKVPRRTSRLTNVALVIGASAVIALIGTNTVSAVQADYYYSQARAKVARPVTQSYLKALNKTPGNLSYWWRAVAAAPQDRRYSLYDKAELSAQINARAQEFFPESIMIKSSTIQAGITLLTENAKLKTAAINTEGAQNADNTLGTTSKKPAVKPLTPGQIQRLQDSLEKESAQLLEMAPSYTHALYLRGRVLLMQGNRDQARVYAKKAYELSNNSSLEAQQLLNELGPEK